MDKFVVMISGANRGIGLAIAEQLFQEDKYFLSLGIRNINNFDSENMKNFFKRKGNFIMSHNSGNQDNFRRRSYSNKKSS